MSFVFTPDYIYAPDKSLDIKNWRFAQDLRQFFPQTEGRGKYGNNTIGDILIKRGVANRLCSVDTEYSCTYVDFKSKRAADAFLKRLNAMPEVKDWKAPEPTHFLITASEWNRMTAFLKKTLTAKQMDALRSLDIMYQEITEPGGYN